jgi:hypothetical protein
MTQQTPQKRGFGCLGYGCIVAVILIVVTIGGIFWLARSAMRGAVERFTTEQPMSVPTVALDAAASSSLKGKLDALAATIKDPRGAGEFTLSQAEVSAAVSEKQFNGKVLVELQDDTVATTFSFPLSAMGPWDSAKPIIGDFMNRYVIGSARAKVSVTDGVASVVFDSLTLNGQVFDGDALKEASEWVTGFANSQGDDPGEQKRRARVQSVRIQSGLAVVRVKPE